MTPTTIPSPTRRRRGARALTAVALAGAAAAAAAAPAAADSIVFVKDANVWLANPDGSGQYQVTTDGTADNPYQSPTQADDGTIVTVRAKPNLGPLILLRQNGAVVREVPVALMQFGPFEPAISPDGRRIAYQEVYRDSFQTTSDVRITESDRLTSPLVYGTPGPGAGSPAWIGNERIFIGSYTSARTMVPGQGPVEWWNDWDHARQLGNSEDLDDGDVAANGNVAFVRGDRDDNTIQLYHGDGGLASRPQPTCTLSNPSPGPNGKRFEDPTFAPSGNALAWQEGDGVWTVTFPEGNCGRGVPRLTIPGASEPDWGPAPVNPGPRPQTETPGERSGGQVTRPDQRTVVDPPRRPTKRTAASASCAKLRGAKRDACELRAALARCAAGPKRRRAACVTAARRSAAVKACRRKPAKQRRRCVAQAKRRR